MQNSKMKILIVFFTILIISGIVIFGYKFFNIPTFQNYKSGKNNTINEPIGELAQIPSEYMIYRNYLEKIVRIPKVKDTAVIEATLTSIIKSELCPYSDDENSEEKCSIEPYPKDGGFVRIDKIIQYTPYTEKSGYTVEEPTETKLPPSSEDGQTTPSYKGEELPVTQLPNYERLLEGQKVYAYFLLTARPTKVRYTSVDPTKQTITPSGSLELVQEQLNEQPVSNIPELGKRIYNSIPKEGEYFVFTTKILPYPETSQKILPGLIVGSKFRAEISYDSTLYIDEYEILP